MPGMSWRTDCTPAVTPYVPEAGSRAQKEQAVIHSIGRIHGRPADRHEDLEWQDRALCAQTDPEAFFPAKGGSLRAARKTCQACEVRPECLNYAITTNQEFGVWGGLSANERGHREEDEEAA